MQSVLTEARVARERVVVTGHIPPGVWSGCWVRVPALRSGRVSTAFACAARALSVGRLPGDAV